MKSYIYLVFLVGVITSSVTNASENDFVKQARLPTDVDPSCTANIKSWFVNGISPNGWVKPANSEDKIFADFKDNTRCDFYKWGAQMFLWLTSGQNNQHVFNTPPTFYNVSVAEDGERHYITSSGPMQMAVRKGKVDEEIELGQAGGGDVLLSQKNSLVYYGLHANDVFALYTTGAQVQSTIILPSHFPSTKDEVQSVVEFAKSYGYTVSSPEAMAMELKTSWVDASTVADKSKYVLSQAVVPVFDRKAIDSKTGNQQWTIIGNEEKTLALVGMHVVGTVNGHPEMVWSTFEHVNNAPDNSYVYKTKNGSTATVAYNSSGTWNFTTSNVAKPNAITANAAVASYSGSDAKCQGSNPTNASECIVNTTKNIGISPIDILRVDPWGDNHAQPTDSSVVSNNTDLVSINLSVLSQLDAGDVRGNYIQTGGIWTAKGQIPINGDDPNLRGSLNLANTTMETFYQYQHDGGFNPKNCFGCHGSAQSDATAISHIIQEMQPLAKK